MIVNNTFLVADDHSVIRQGIVFLLKDKYPSSTILQAATFKEVLKLVKANKINLLFLDINFPDGVSLGIISTIKKFQPNIKILFFSAYDEDIYAIRYLNAGANGYLNKLSTDQEFENAVNSVLTDGKYMSENIQNKITDAYIFKKPSNPLEQLSNREIEIAKLLIDGVANNAIAEVLNLKKTTVSTYKNRVFEKLGIDNIPSLISLFSLYYFKDV